MQKVVDWIYTETADGDLIYSEADLGYLHSAKDPSHDRQLTGMPHNKYYLVPHKGQKRYIAVKMLHRFYDKGQAGTAGTSVTLGSAQTTCDSSGTGSSNMYGSSYGNTFERSAYGSFNNYTNCTTSPAPQINILGQAARRAGVSTNAFVLVGDCKDQTAVIYFNGKLKGKWFPNPDLWDCDQVKWESMEQLELKL